MVMVLLQKGSLRVKFVNLRRIAMAKTNTFAEFEKSDKDSAMNMKNKTAVITGATSGLGKELATELAKKNFNLLLIGHDNQRLENLKNELRKLGKGNLITQTIDLSIMNSMYENLEKMAQTVSVVDYVFCCAGIRFVGDGKDMTLEKLSQMMSVNYFSVVFLVKVLVSKIQKQGHIFMISSGAANYGVMGDSGYCSSKAALDRFSEALYSELKPQGIMVTSVSPGPMETKLFRGSQSYSGQTVSPGEEETVSPQIRAQQIMNQIGQDKRRLNLTLSTFIVRVLSTFAPFVLDILIRKKK